MPKLVLPNVTLCAVTSVNVAATIEAMRACLAQIAFADAVLLSDAPLAPPMSVVRLVPIERLASARDYSHFLLRRLAAHIATDYCLIVQWDGFVLDAERWDPVFLDFDYVGAPWPQFADGHDVGNGGFSLRSAKLLRACADPRFETGHPEDLAIGRTNRRLLEREFGIRFADAETAARFSYERSAPAEPTFGFHGVFNMIPALGPERFWQIYRTLDHRTTTFADVGLLARQVGTGPSRWRRRMILAADRLKASLGR